MPGRRVAVTLVGIAVTVLAASQIYKIVSLKAGIKQAQENLNRVDLALLQNEEDGNELLRKIVADLTPVPANPDAPTAPAKKTPASGAEQVLDQLLVHNNQLPSPPQEPSATGIDPVASLRHTYLTILQNPKGTDLNYSLAVSNALERIVETYGSKDLKLYVKATNLTLDLYEGHTILSQRARFIALRNEMWLNLMKLQQKDPENRAEWEALLNRLEADPEKEHAAFKKWLLENGIDEKRLVSDAFQHASTVNSSAAAQLACGAAIIDPSDVTSGLESIPNLNPAFIQSMERFQEFLEQGNLQAAAITDRDANGEYIPLLLAEPKEAVTHPHFTECSMETGLNRKANGTSAPGKVVDIIDIQSEVSKSGCCLWQDEKQADIVFNDVKREMLNGRRVKDMQGHLMRPSQITRGFEYELKGSAINDGDRSDFKVEVTLVDVGKGKYTWNWIQRPEQQFEKCLDQMDVRQGSLIAHCESDEPFTGYNPGQQFKRVADLRITGDPHGGEIQFELKITEWQNLWGGNTSVRSLTGTGHFRLASIGSSSGDWYRNLMH